MKRRANEKSWVERASLVLLIAAASLILLGGATLVDASTLTVLPDKPSISPLGATVFEQHSVSNATVFYNINPTNGWNGVMVHWANFVGKDLSSFTQFVFGVTGTPQAIKVEFEDTSSDKSTFILDGVTGTMGHWAIPSSMITQSDLSSIKVISFVVDGDLAGAGNTNGQYTFYVDGLDFRPGQGVYDVVSSSPTGELTVLEGYPDVAELGGTPFVRHSATNFTVFYNLVNEDSWNGVMVRWTDFASQDLTGYTTFVFGVTGTPAAIKAEFEDTNGVKTVFNLRGVTDTLNYWHIDASLITNLHQIKVISFVVDRALAGEGNISGAYTVFTGGLDDRPGQGEYDVPSVPVGPISVLPEQPQVSPLGTTPFIQHSVSNFTTFYNLPAEDSWNGTMIHWPDWEGRDLSSYEWLTIAVTGTPQAIKVEFEDTNGVKTLFNLRSVTGSMKYWWIETSLITNLHGIKVISFVTDRTLAGEGNTSGQFTAFIGGLQPLSTEGVYDVEPSSPAATEITRMPGPPQPMITDLNGTPFTQHSSSNFSVGYNLSATNEWNGVMVHWEDFPARDLSSITQFVFGALGTPESVKMEFVDGDTNKTVFYLREITNSLQHYVIPSSLITNLNNITVLSFVVDGPLAGTGNTNGQFTIYLGGLKYSWTVEGEDSGSPTVLPGLPIAIPVGGANGETEVVNTNASLISVKYNCQTGSWSGATILYDNYGTEEIFESEDLSAFSEIVFGLYGDAPSVKVEFLDDEDQVVLATAINVTDTPKYYSFDTSMITCDVSRIRMINFVLDAGVVGEGNEEGDLHILSGGLNYDILVAGSESGSPTILPDSPQVALVGGANLNTVLKQFSSSEFSIAYDVGLGGWAGASILFDDYGTVPIETADLSGYSVLVFAVTGSADRIAFEILDEDDNKMAATLLSADSATWQYYTVDLSHLASKGVDGSRVRMINFVVDQDRAGAGNWVGAFGVRSGGLDYPYTVIGETTGVVSDLPANSVGNRAIATPVGGANGDTTVTRMPDGVYSIFYNVATGGWSGLTILFDDYATDPIESADLSGYTSLVFRVKGDVCMLKFEFEDADTNKVGGLLSDISGDWQYFQIPTADLVAMGLDLEHVRSINFVVDETLTCGADAGTFEVYVTGLAYDILVAGEDTGVLSEFPPPAPKLDLVGGGNGDTVIEQYSSSLFKVFYNVTTGGWSGVSILYDDFGTLPVETGDLGGFSEFVIRVRGTASALQFELQDDAFNGVAGRLTGIGPDWQYFRIPMNELVERGLDPEAVAVFSLVIAQESAGAGNEVGYIEVETRGVGFANPAYGVRDEDGDGIPDDWEDDNFGSITGANAEDDDDEDGVNNRDEYYAGTDPWDETSFPRLNIERQGTHFALRIDAVNQRLYQILRTTNLVNGAWEDVTARVLAELDGDMVMMDNLGDMGSAYFKCRINFTPHSPMPGQPRVYMTGGSNGDGAVQQVSSREFTVSYVNVETGYVGGTISFDDYGTEPIEYADLSGYDFLTFGISGTPTHLKYEFEDVWTNRVMGSLRYVTGEMRTYRIDTTWLVEGGLDITRVRSVNFIVDGLHAAPALTGSFTVRSFGLGYDIEASGESAGTATVLPSPTAVAYDLGGANQSGNWALPNWTNIQVNYNVTTGGWEGVTLSHDDFGTEPVESASYAGMGTVVFGIYGDPERIKIEFQDALGNKGVAIINGVEATQKFYSISLDDLDALGLVVSRMRLISFVVDEGLAGGTTEGVFHVVTDGLLP